MEILCVVAADDHGESIFEAQRLSNFEVEAIGVQLLDAVVHVARIALWRFIQDRRERGAGVFDVDVQLAGEKSFVDQERASEISLALDGNPGLGFDVLGEELREDDLLGEKF